MSRKSANPLEEPFSDLTERLKASRSELPRIPEDFKTALHARLIAQYPLHRQSVRLVPISLALATIIIIGLLVWFTAPRPVSAAEILSRASQAATDAAAFGLKSYSGTKIMWYNNTMQPGQLFPNSKDVIWVKLPDLLHDDHYDYPSDLPAYSPTAPALPDSSIPMALSAMFINDGYTVWWYQVSGNSVEKHTSAAMPLPRVPKDFQSLMKELDQDNNSVTQLGAEIVAGRGAYVLSFVPKSDIAVQAFQIKVWIDKETYVQLGEEYLDKSGTIVYKWLYTDFNANVDIVPEKFAFKPAPAMRIVDLRTPKNEADLTLAWRTIALSTDFTVFRPTDIPPGIIMERPHADGGYSSVAQVQQAFYADGEDLPALLLAEDKGIADRPTIGLSTKIGGYDGHYYEEAGQRTLQLVRDGTWIILQADQHLITKDELFKIAQAMELVPKS